MRLGYMLLGSLLGWMVASVAVGVVLGSLAVYAGLEPGAERYGVAAGALAGILLGGWMGWAYGSEKRTKRDMQYRRQALRAAPTRQHGETLSSQLVELAQLRDRGQISETEYVALRQRAMKNYGR